jgi:hypothetical protein
MVRITAVPAGPAASAGPPWLSSTTQSIAAVIASILIVLGLGLLARAAELAAQHYDAVSPSATVMTRVDNPKEEV